MPTCVSVCLLVYYPMVLVHDPFVPTPDTIGDQPLETANKQPKEYDKKKANFVAMVQYMDKLVGKIVDKVDSLGLSDDTIIMFTADNGTHPSLRSMWNGREIRGGKGGMKDNGTHVPLVVRWKGSKVEGVVEKSLVDHSDFYATFAEAAGVQIPDENLVDGVSFLPQLKGEIGNPREWVLCHYQPYWGKKPGQYVRNARFKLYRSGSFFEVPVDLEEANNLSFTKNPEMLKVLAQLKKIVDQCPPVPQDPRGQKGDIRPTYPAQVID